MPNHQDGDAAAGHGDTLLGLLAAGAAADSAKPALIHLADPLDGTPIVWSYGRLLDTAAAAARALRDGAVPGEGVAILAPSIPEHLAAIVAASAVAVAFPLNPLLTPQAMVAQLAVAEAGTAIVIGEHPASDINGRARQAIARAPTIRRLIEIAPTASAPRPGVEAMTWGELVRRGAAAPSFAPRTDGAAALFHTGGTSGAPKLAELGARSLAAGPRLAAEAIGWRSDDVVLNLLPYFHVGGALAVAMSALATGATLVTCGIAGARTPGLMDAFWSLVERLGVTVPALVPTSWTAAADRLPPRRPTRLRGLLTGAAPMPVSLARRLEQGLGVPLSQVFGMTEAAGICSAQPVDGRFRPHAVGYPPGGVEIRLEEGELHVAGVNLFSGYRLGGGRRLGSGTSLATGDLGRLLADGQLALDGRRKDVIIRSGHNIDPASIEQAAFAHPDVVEAAAVGMPDAYAGEVPVLYVVRRTRHEPIDALLAAVAAGIEEPPARPRAVIDLDRLPLTPSGKIERYRLRQDAACRKAREVLGDLLRPELDVTCVDAAARRLRVVRREDGAATRRDGLDRAEVERRLQPLGLDVEAADPDPPA